MSQPSAIQNQTAADPAAAHFGLLQEGQDRDKDIEHLVAANLARLRAMRHLSLDALARLSGVSRAMLAQIEAGRSVPSIRSVHRIASALQVSVAAFLRDFAFDGMQLLPAAAAPRLVSANGSFASRNLFPAQSRRRTEFQEIRQQAAGIEYCAALLPGSCKNLVLVHGRLEICANAQTLLLGPGDAAFFDADRIHSYRNPGDSEALAYVVTQHPEGEHR